jgi:hypothetical protein
MPQYDGEIRINTKVDTENLAKDASKVSDEWAKVMEEAAKGAGTEGMTEGIEKTVEVTESLGTELAVVLGSFAAIAAILVLVVVAAVALGVAIAKMGVQLYNWSRNLINTMLGAMDSTTGYAKQLEEIKIMYNSVQQAMYAAFSPLISMAIPYIQMVTDFLVKMFNTLAMILASLFKQANVWQYVAGSTKKAGQAAKDALAPFDELNVLQQDQGGQNVGAGAFTWTPVDPEALKNFWGEVQTLGEEIWTKVKEWGGKTWDNIVADLQTAWDEIKAGWEESEVELGLVFENIKNRILDNSKTAREEWATMKDEFLADMEIAKTFILDTWADIKWGIGIVIDDITKWWKTGIDDVKKYAAEQWPLIQALFTIDWWQTKVIDPMKLWWDTGMTSMKDTFSLTWQTIKNTADYYIGLIVKAVVGMVNSIITAVNNALTWIAKLGGITIPGIPLLFIPTNADNKQVRPTSIAGANGLVIPPNAAFSAVLGDQTSGLNIEAPEDLIRKIVREESGNREVIIKFEGSLSALARVLKPYTDKENSRVGLSLVT